MESTQESLETHLGPLQRSRWVYTINNYSTNFNFRSHLSKEEYKVKRSVWGFEVGEEGTQHVQGYLELVRSYRLCFVRRIFPNAYWNAARKPVLENYEYCTKQGRYDCIGDFSNIFSQRRGGNKAPATVPMIVEGLLNKKQRHQIIVSKEYADRHLYFDRTQSKLLKLKETISCFDKWKTVKLFPWQFKIINLVMEQSKREVLWVVDQTGNNGKTFLGDVLNILYGFTLLNDKISSHDIGPLLEEIKGFVFDIPRAKLENFDYALLECVKNGYLSSGKYNGVLKRFEPVPVVVFANAFPVLGQLSIDRWKIIELGSGDFTDLRRGNLLDLPSRFNLFIPPKFPNMNENFNLREYLQNESNTLNQNRHHEHVQATTSYGDNVPFNGSLSSQDSGNNMQLVLPASPICVIHPDQGIFRKGCPCLSKNSRRTLRRNSNNESELVNLTRKKRTPSTRTRGGSTSSLLQFISSLD